MTRIQIGSWSTHPSLDGAEIIVGDTIEAVVAEPWGRIERRSGRPYLWTVDQECRWRDMVLRRAGRIVGRRRPAWVQFDPGRDQAQEVAL